MARLLIAAVVAFLTALAINGRADEGPVRVVVVGHPARAGRP